MSNLRAAIDKINADLAAQHAENDARVAREYEAAQAKKAEELKAKKAESAKYLNSELPTSNIGQPTWNYYSPDGRYANIKGADGKEYMFVPDDYVKKGTVSGDIQLYNKQFLDPATFKNAVQYTLPQGMQSVINNNGYVWSVDDYNKLGLQNANGYKVDANNPPILGLGNPHPSMQVGSPISYITQPKLAPGGERVQQDWITAADGRMGGLGQYAYYKYQGPFADMARGALKELGPLTPILLDVFAGPGTGAIYTMSRAAGEATYTGDWNKAATTIGTIMAAPYVADYVGGALGSAVDMGAVANSIVGSAAGNAVVAGLTGGDPLAAFVNGGVGGAVGTIMGKIDGFSQLPPSVQRVFNATLRAELSGKDPSKAALLAATTSGLQAIKNGMDANAKFQSTYGRDATPEELNNFAYVQNQDELNQSFDEYMKTTAAQDSARQAEIDAQNKADAEASAQQAAIAEQNRLDAETSARQAAIDEQNRLDAEASARQAAIDEQNRLDEKAQEPIGALPTEPILDNELEPPSTLPTEPILDDELGPPEEGPEDCAPGYHWNGSMCVADEDKPPESTDCPDGYVYDLDSKSCVPISDDPTNPTKPTSPLPVNLKTPTTNPTTTTTPTGGLPATTQTAQNPMSSIPWLDTKAQMLETKKAPSVMNPFQPLKQLYDNVDPTLMNVLADRGIAPQEYSQGSSVSSVLSQFSSELDKSLPKFAESKNPFLSMGSRKATSTEPAKLPQLRPGLTGHAKGGLPDKYAKAAPKGHNPEFITGLTGFYANGRGTGQSDDIPAMLHDGDYVMDADTVAALGDGSSKAGALTLADFQKQVPHEYKEGGNAVPAKIADGEYVFPEPMVTALGGGDNKKGAQMLDAMREEIRAHKRSAPTSKIPPKSKSPLDYLKMVKG